MQNKSSVSKELSNVDSLNLEAKHLAEKLADLGIFVESKHNRWSETRSQYNEAKANCELKRIKLEDLYQQKNEIAQRLKKEKRFRSDFWDEYNAFKNEKNEEIQPITRRIQEEAISMKNCFANASVARKNNDTKFARQMCEEANRHKATRDKLKAQRESIVELIREKKRETLAKIEANDDSEFTEANSAYEEAAKDYAALKQKRNTLDAECTYYEKEFRSAETGYNRIKKKYNQAIYDLQQAESAERAVALANAEIDWSELPDAKVIVEQDGTTQIYHGGLGVGDGYGHGHTVLDPGGNIVYRREAFASHGAHNYVK